MLKTQCGFSIIEVIISIFVVGAMLVVYGRLNESIAVNRGIGHQEVALRVARGQIENLRAIPYNSLPPTGSFEVPVWAQGQLPQGSAGYSNTAFNDGVKNIAVTVSWVEPGAGARNVSLTTLISQGGL